MVLLLLTLPYGDVGVSFLCKCLPQPVLAGLGCLAVLVQVGRACHGLRLAAGLWPSLPGLPTGGRNEPKAQRLAATARSYPCACPPLSPTRPSLLSASPTATCALVLGTVPSLRGLLPAGMLATLARQLRCGSGFVPR